MTHIIIGYGDYLTLLLDIAFISQHSSIPFQCSISGVSIFHPKFVFHVEKLEAGNHSLSYMYLVTSGRYLSCLETLGMHL